MQPLYDSIGSTYRATRCADPAITRELARLVGIESDGRYLDLACGTGNYTCALAHLGGKWHGVDPSRVMLDQARAKCPTVEWKEGSAEALPFPDGSFSGVICSLAIHHFPELPGPFREVRRVLDRGRFVIFTAFPEQMRGYWLCHYFPEMMRRSIEQMPSRESVAVALQEAGFTIEEIVPFPVTDRLQDLFLYAGKERPGLYLDPLVRANISSFAALCSPDELEAGLCALRDDLESGEFGRVAERYSSPDGDYVFVAGSKGGKLGYFQ